MTAIETTKRSRARRGEGEKLREQILAAADRLLIDTGNEEAVSIRAVADAVGVTSPSIYLHFADKNDLLFAVCLRHFQRFDEVIEAAGRESDDPLESLKRRGRAYIQFGLDNPEHYRIMFMRKPEATPPGFQDELMRQTAAFDHLVEAVHRCIEANVFPGDPLEVSLVLWSWVHGLTSLLISKPDFPWPDRDHLIDYTLTVAVQGLHATR